MPKPRASAASVAPFKPPALKTFNRYADQLTRVEYDDLDETGKPVTRRWPLPTVDENSQLIPLSDALATEAELEPALVNATYDEASFFARRLMGLYPRRQLNDAKIFIFELTRVFAEGPPDLGEEAINILRSEEWLPAVPKVRNVLMALVAERRGALRQVRLHIREHERRRDGAAAEGERLSEMIAAFKTAAPAVEAALGAEAFNAIWPSLWIVSAEVDHIVVAQPTVLWADLTRPHLPALEGVFQKRVDLIVRRRPAKGERRGSDAGPCPIGDAIDGGNGE